MKQEDKELLLKDLCARLPYGVKGRIYAETAIIGEYDMESGHQLYEDTAFIAELNAININEDTIHVTAIGNEDTISFIDEQQEMGEPYTVEGFEPYLRSLSSMTEEESKEFAAFTSLSMHRFTCNETNTCHWYNAYEEEDWLNAHHFDYRKTKDGKTMIEAGLALEAPAGMYNENK